MYMTTNPNIYFVFKIFQSYLNFFLFFYFLFFFFFFFFFFFVLYCQMYFVLVSSNQIYGGYGGSFGTILPNQSIFPYNKYKQQIKTPPKKSSQAFISQLSEALSPTIIHGGLLYHHHKSPTDQRPVPHTKEIKDNKKRRSKARFENKAASHF